MGDNGDSARTDGGKWTIDAASTVGGGSDWSSWGGAAAGWEKVPSPFSVDGNGGDTASSQCRSGGARGGAGSSFPRREIRARGRASRWDRGADVGSRSQEGLVWRRSVHLPLSPSGSLLQASAQTVGLAPGDGDLLVDMEQADQEVALQVAALALGIQKSSAPSVTNPLSQGSRSDGGVFASDLPPGNASSRGSGADLSASRDGTAQWRRVPTNDRTRVSASAANFGLEEGFNSLGHSAAAHKAPRAP